MEEYDLKTYCKSAEETAFLVGDVSNTVKEAVESAVGGNTDHHSKVNHQLTKLGKPVKCSYIVTWTIMQKKGAGSHSASSCFWDSSADGSCTVRLEEETMCCAVRACGLSI
uniref:Uncharacterized protein n=1 Tax=Rhinolophus ferrumequinum TaxID=59479 RepID=A0A671DIX0_RHIFE